MSQMQQTRNGGAQILRRRGRFSAVTRRAAEYFVDPGRERLPAPRDEATAEFELEVPGAWVRRPATLTLPLTRAGGYEREAVDARLAELEAELTLARAAAAPTGVEGEIHRLGEETAEILRVAHLKAEALVARAADEAATLGACARADADAVTRTAELRLRDLDSETDLIWAERTRLTGDTLRLAEALRAIAESAVERFPAAIDEAPPAPAPAPTPTPAGPCLTEPGEAALQD